jgi:hypothetical protein
MRSILCSFTGSESGTLLQSGEVSRTARSSAQDAATLLLIVAVFLVFILWVYLRTRSRLDAQRQLEAKAQADFERRMSQEFSAAAAAAADKEGTPPHASAADQSWIAPARERLIGRLREINLLLSEEGECKLPDCPRESRMIRLRDQRIALIVPFADSRKFVQDNYKRFDLFFLLLNKDETAVLQRYQDYVVEKLHLI